MRLTGHSMTQSSAAAQAFRSHPETRSEPTGTGSSTPSFLTSTDIEDATIRTRNPKQAAATAYHFHGDETCSPPLRGRSRPRSVTYHLRPRDVSHRKTRVR